MLSSTYLDLVVSVWEEVKVAFVGLVNHETRQEFEERDYDINSQTTNNRFISFY